MKSLLRAVSLGGFLLAVPGLALAAPGIPHQFYGTVSYESGTAPDGLTVQAKVGGVVVGSSVTKGGRYGINPNLLLASKADGEWGGETVTFFVDGIDSGESSTLTKGGYTNLGLTVPGAAPGTTTSTPQTTTTTTTNSGGSGGGGGGGSSAVTTTTTTTTATTQTTTTTLTAEQKVYDTNTDSKIDVMDFNALMVHWGEAGAAVVADFDGNGSVDVFDFNSLMVHWTA